MLSSLLLVLASAAGFALLRLWERRALVRAGASVASLLASRRTVAQAEANQRCAITGRVVADSELLTSALGHRCVMHRLLVQRVLRDDDGSTFVTLYKQGEAIPFRLADETGAIEVEIEGLTLACEPIVAATLRFAEGATLDAIERALNAAGKSLHDDFARRDAYEAAAQSLLDGHPIDPAPVMSSHMLDNTEYEEVVLAPGDHVTIVGRVVERDTPAGPVRVLDARSSPAYVLTPRSVRPRR